MDGFKLGKMTLGSLFKKPETILYPMVTKEIPVGLKGHVANDVDHCILCGICMKRCPTGAITVDKPGRVWAIDRFRCVQCGNCVRECPKSCLYMEPTYIPPAPRKSIDSFEVPEQVKPVKASKPSSEA